VTVERLAQGAFTVTNIRGGQLGFIAGSDTGSAGGDQARAILPGAVKKLHDRCARSGAP
jgi:hypothetical protein